MAGGSESRRSLASASVAAQRAEATVADAPKPRYNDSIGRVRKERAVWPGAAFIVEALLLLVFLTGSLAVLMNLNAEADRIGRESADLMDGLVLASNVAEEVAADPIAFKEAYEAATGEPCVLYSTGGGTYARHTNNRAVGFGPEFPGTIDNHAHNCNEQISLENFFTHAQICLEAMYLLFTK